MEISYPQLCLGGTGGEGDSGGVAHRDRLRPFSLLLMDQQAHWRLFWVTAPMTYTSCFHISSGLSMAGALGFPCVLSRLDSGPACCLL